MILELEKFLYWKGHDTKNHFVHGYIFTRDATLASQYLAKQGIQVQHLKAQWRLVKAKRLKRQTTMSFYQQLSALLRAGVSLTQALTTLATMQKDFFQKVVLSLKMHIEMGHSFYASLQQFPRHFDYFSCRLIHIAENTGTLDTMLDQIAHHHEKKKALNDKLKQALLYPALILTSAILVTFLMLLFVVPQFESIFAEFNAPLPTMTLVIIQLSRFLRNHSEIFLIPPLSCYLFFYFYRSSTKFKSRVQQIFSTWPLLLKLRQTYFSAKFAHALSLMLAAGIPLSNALVLLERQELQTPIAQGFSLHHAMQGSILFSPLTQQMVKVGEESGMLASMLQHVATLHDAEIQHMTQQFTQLLEPLIIIMLGVLIGCLVISMYLPIFKLGTVM